MYLNTLKIVLNKYSSHFSKHDFTQPALFTLLAVKIYTRSTYRQITDLLELSDKIQQYLHLKKDSTFHNTPEILSKTTHINIARIKQTNINQSSNKW